MIVSQGRGDEPHLNELFNFGIKANDVEAEKAFFEAFRPERSFFLDRSKSATGPKQVPAVQLGGVRFFMFSTLAYDSELSQPHQGGLSHVAFMVDNLDDLVANLQRQGISPLRGPYVVDTGDLGHRKVVFYRSPNGTIIEPQELLKST